jgi:hypothetical protein
MKAKLFFLTLALALCAILRPATSGAASTTATLQKSCALFCAQVFCIPEDICGSYVNSSGQTVCGCHPRP